MSQVCGAGAQCNDTVLNAAIQAQGANADAAAGTLQPNYATGGISVLSGTGGASVNLYDGTIYLSGGVAQNFPAPSWNPGLTATAGWILGAHDAKSTNEFMAGDANQAFVSVPTPFNVNLIGAVTHAYGGSTAIEIGISSPGGLNYGVVPWSHGAAVTNANK